MKATLPDGTIIEGTPDEIVTAISKVIPVQYPVTYPVPQIPQPYYPWQPKYPWTYPVVWCNTNGEATT